MISGSLRAALVFGALLWLSLATHYRAHAEEKYWDGGDGDWAEPSNWVGGLPGSEDEAILGQPEYSSGVVTVSMDVGCIRALEIAAGSMQITGTASLLVSSESSLWEESICSTDSLSITGAQAYLSLGDTALCGHVRQSAGSVDIGCIVVGYGDMEGDYQCACSDYELTGGQCKVYGGMTVGAAGLWGNIGDFLQTGGDATFYGDVSINHGHYEHRGGTVSFQTVGLGSAYQGGHYIQTGGTVSFNSTVEVGQNYSGSGHYTQSGGTAIFASLLLIGHDGPGEYTLSDDDAPAALNAESDVWVGQYGYGSYVQKNGTATVGDDVGDNLWIGGGDGASCGTGEATLEDGTMTIAGNMNLGSWGGGTFTQTGGVLHVTNVSIAYEPELPSPDAPHTDETSEVELAGGESTITGTVGVHSRGTLTVSGGCLYVNAVDLLGGTETSQGTLSLLDATAWVQVTESLRFGQHTTVDAVPEASIHMTGAALRNETTDAEALAGLENLEFIFDGGSDDTCTFEVAGKRRGGFGDNFSVGTLTVGSAEAGNVQLIDDFDNGNRGTTGEECLFVHSLKVDESSMLDLNGLRVYVEGDVASTLDAWIADGRVFDSTEIPLDATYIPAQDWTFLPEPTTLALLALGAAGVMARRRRR